MVSCNRMLMPYKIPIDIQQKISSAVELPPNSIQTVINNGISLNQNTQIRNGIDDAYTFTVIISHFEIMFYLWITISVLFLAYHMVSYYIYNKKLKY